MGTDETTLRFARPSEREALEALQRRASVHEPMYRAQLEAHPDAIELPAEQIAAGLVRVAEQGGAVAGFSVLLERSGDACELDGLFVEPDRMRTGVGRRLIDDAKLTARRRGASRIDVVANPQAAAFYAAVGFRAAGEAQTRFGPAPRMSLAVNPSIGLHHGSRASLRGLFELAEDSAAELDAYIDAGRVLVAEEAGEVVGHLQLTETGTDDELEVKNMAVLPRLQGRGVGRALIAAALELARSEGRATLLVATAAADIGNLRFYQRLGFRMRSVERDAFTPATGYAAGIVIDGIELRDRVWLDRSVAA
jgi:predicted N-acetyltransferase YhbS